MKFVIKIHLNVLKQSSVIFKRICKIEQCEYQKFWNTMILEIQWISSYVLVNCVLHHRLILDHFWPCMTQIAAKLHLHQQRNREIPGRTSKIKFNVQSSSFIWQKSLLAKYLKGFPCTYPNLFVGNLIKKQKISKKFIALQG